VSISRRHVTAVYIAWVSAVNTRRSLTSSLTVPRPLMNSNTPPPPQVTRHSYTLPPSLPTSPPPGELGFSLEAKGSITPDLAPYDTGSSVKWPKRFCSALFDVVYDTRVNSSYSWLGWSRFHHHHHHHNHHLLTEHSYSTAVARKTFLSRTEALNISALTTAL